MYEPLEVSKCKKCGNVMAEPKELTRIQKKHQSYRASCVELTSFKLSEEINRLVRGETS